jgi:hypothetical protein
MAYLHGRHLDFQVNHFDVYRDVLRAIPYFPIPGNHEYETPQAEPYVSVHAVPTENVPAADHGRYYSFDWGNAHFICLDSNKPLERAVAGDGEMLRWLERDLRATRQFWRIAAVHHPPYAAGPNQSDPVSGFVRGRIVPLLEKYGVQLVLSGHEHSYQRTVPLRGGAALPENSGTIYMTLGGGGGALYPVFLSPQTAVGRSAHHYLKVQVNGTQMNLSAIGIGGGVLDNFRLNPLPVVTEDSFFGPVSIIPYKSGSLVRIRGRSLAAEERFVGRAPSPTELAGVSVMIDGRPVALSYVSSTQIWGRTEAPVRGPFILRLTNSNGSTESTVRL